MKFPPLWLGIFLVSLALRVVAITVPINSDEVLWMTRGSTFIKHLLEGDLTGTYLRHHPGVTNMWLIGISMLFNCQLHKVFPGLDQPANLDACLDTVQFPIAFYVLPRLLQAAIASGCMVYLYVLTKRLLGRSVALCTLSLLLLEPFFLAYQRYLTTDALMADFSVLALLLFLLYLRGDVRRDRKLLILSGAFMGLATVTKVTALFLLPAITIWVVLSEFGVWRIPQKGWKRRFADLRWWGGSILVTIIAIWPAMWVSPSYVVSQIYKGVLNESARGLLFFLGQITDSPGVIFYPLVLAYRLSPVLQVGLLAVGAVLVIPRLQRTRDKADLTPLTPLGEPDLGELDQRLAGKNPVVTTSVQRFAEKFCKQEVIALALVPLSVLLILSASDSKIDRYINLFLPVLAILAAVGWLEIARWVRFGAGKINRGVTSAIALFLLQLIFLVPYCPYYLSYYNPLFGGSRVAKDIFMIGQGEGLDLAAKWLNQSPNAKQIVAASWSGRAFGAYFQGQTISIYKFVEPEQPWTKANRVVLYYNQFQRQLPDPKMLAYFGAQQPLHTVRLHNIDYAKIYPGAVPLAEDLKRIQFPLDLYFGEQVRLRGYDLKTSKFSLSQEILITFYWEFLTPLPPDLTINISLRDRVAPIATREGKPLDGYLSQAQTPSGSLLRDVHKLTLPPGTLPQRYRLEVGWFSDSNKQALPVRDAAGNSPGTQAVIGEVEVVN
ncbi:MULTISPECIES: ArnT family glycosyltransferase [Cyanophyceae]|uniref:ArnT family glycosyltransferase n=1 Tax=Cyanophyceae TaxID=3028117 RepID=UPI0016827E3E|nr:glycosyltransferase family 39 protein [Trichocoleus sp. FACHB-40]MBD2002262.1 glycosyltransferase family 39 protein [Trichocoleus sp. FACHB-40]